MKFCPQCGSSNLDWVLPHDQQKWQCKDCGYVGAFIVDDGKIAEQVRKEYLKKQSQDTDNKS